ncbi:MAG: flagellar biosynthesis anti-sigma factor FlgM [Desulfobaccales bacterium]
MNERDHQGPGIGSAPSSHNGDGTEKPGELSSGPVQSAANPGNDQLKKKVRQIIAATPEVRPEKVGPLKQAIEQGTYEIDARKVANALITKLILDP